MDLKVLGTKVDVNISQGVPCSNLRLKKFQVVEMRKEPKRSPA